MRLTEYIDHTLLNPSSSKEGFIDLCQEANEHMFASVCVPQTMLTLCDSLLNKEIPLCTVVGFPLGYNSSEAKQAEVSILTSEFKQRKLEIDMVINPYSVITNDYKAIQDEIGRIKDICKNRILKVIIETCQLTETEILKLTEVCVKAQADYVKTSTGFRAGGAVLEQVQLISDNFKNDILIKASGGIKNKSQALSFIKAGASRIGTSNGLAIIDAI